MPTKVLMVCSNSPGGAPGKIPGTKKGGWYLEECAHPYLKFEEAGYDITLCSILGGDITPFVDPDSIADFDKDPAKEALWKSKAFKEKMENTKPLAKYKGSDFDVFFMVGGFGVMWDFYPSVSIDRVGRETYESGGIVGAVCHGPIGLASIKLSDGTPLVKGKKVGGFNNEEEAIVKIKIPTHPEGASCEDILQHYGGLYSKSPKVFQPWVVTDERLVSGQNPPSADGCGVAIVEMVNKSKKQKMMMAMGSAAAVVVLAVAAKLYMSK